MLLGNRMLADQQKKELCVSSIVVINCFVPNLNQLKMQSQTNQACAICSQQPEDMLILSCAHHLCLDCATQLFTASHSAKLLNCQICLAPTPLDQDTINCLQALANRYIEDQQYQEPIIEVVQPVLPRPPKSRRDGCLKHKQKAIYFCFDCQDGSICSQCILEGAHGGHGVMTIKKASKILTDKLVEHSQRLESSQIQLADNTRTLQQLKQSLAAEHQQRATQLRTLFESMIRQVTQRYDSLSQELQRTARRSIEIVEGAVRQTQEQMSRIQQTVQQNRVIIERQEESMIVKRYAQMEATKELLNNQTVPAIGNVLGDAVLTYENSCNSELETLLSKMTWTNKQTLKENQRLKLNGSLESCDNTLLGASPVPTGKGKVLNPYANEPDEIRIECDNSVQNYSGIKRSSRRSELNRSMSNATNIINRLQQRVRR